MLQLPEGLARADGMTGVIIFAVVYAIVSIMAKAKQASQKGAGEGAGGDAEEAAKQQRRAQQRLQQRQQQQQRPRPQQQRQVRPAPPAQSQSRPAGSTQSEGARLEDLLRVLTEAAGVPTTTGGPVERSRPAPLASDEEVEERESLEVEEQIENLETEGRRPARREVDHDDEAEAIVQRRIRAAQERDRSLSKVDHAAFDSRFRAVPDATRVAKPKNASLRQAIIWREILGPPVALRGEDTNQ
jgi:hypothetical protein